MSLFPTMTDKVPPGTRGVASVEHRTVSEHESAMSSLTPGYYCHPGTYAMLRVRGEIMMSDTRHEHTTNYEVVHEARGRVLIAGLGLGMILHPILAKPGVTAVDVVELEQDVIDLIGPTVAHPKLTLYQGDIDTWSPPEGARYDVIYFDIWPSVSDDDYEQMKALVRRFRRYRAKGAWVRCWAVDEIREARRKDAAWAW